MHHLVIKDLSAHYGKVQVLDTVNLDIARGEVIGLMGPSGSGKSTLLSIMAGLDTPSQGSVWLQGQDLFAVDEDRRAALRAQSMGFVFQSFQLLGHLTALENVMLPLELAGSDDAAARARQVLGEVGRTGRVTGPNLHWGLNWFQIGLDPSLSTSAPKPPNG